MDKYSVVYVNNNLIGHFDKDIYVAYSKEEKNKIFIEIENQIIKKDHNRKLSSLIIGLTMLSLAITLLILMLTNVINLGESQWFNFTFVIAGLILLWVLFYYIMGFCFYKKLQINYVFKSKKTSNPNSAVLYASSNYYKWIQQYSSYLQITNFTLADGKTVVPFGLKNPSKYKNLIFNGRISSNVPYFYFSIKSKRIVFLPAMVIIIDGKNSKVLATDDFKVSKKNKTYLFYAKDKLIDTIECKEPDFNINFFYFKYEQL